MSKHPLAEALEQLTDAEREVTRLLKWCFPTNKYISWKTNGDRVYYGHVVRHGYGDRIEVRNDTTQKARWITASQIVLRGPSALSHPSQDQS